jgi:mycofactocin system FadH/OYE family oxidoreductase 2
MNEEFRYLFEPLKVGSVTLKNRIVSPSHSTRFAENGIVSDRLIAYHEARARGGVGLIITEAQPVHPSSVPRLGMIHNWDDRVIPGFKNLSKAVHKYECKIFGQITHHGRQMHSTLIRQPLLAPSPIPCPTIREIPKEMEVEEIKEIVDHFGTAARRLKEGGFDGVEVMIGHGYLLNQFLSPAMNKRTDKYGGSLENRLRIIFEVLDSVRENVGDNFACGVRMDGDEFIEGGLTLDDMKEVARRLEDTGQVDLLNITAGNYSVSYMITAPWYMPLGYLVPVLAEKILEDHQADLIGMVRALIADPEFPKKAQEGRLEDIRTCIGCCQMCSGVGTSTTLFLGCTGNASVGYEKETGELNPCEKRKRVLVIGGGPAGLELARVAAKRGHEVILCEREKELGGQVALIAKDPNRIEFGDIIRFLTVQVQKLGVEVRMELTVTPEMVMELNPDAVVLATGSEPHIPFIPGADKDTVVTTWEVLKQEREVGKRVLVIAGGVGHYGPLTLADFLADQGKYVEVVSTLSVVGGDIEIKTFKVIYQRLLEKGVVLTPFTGVKEILCGEVIVYNVYTHAERRIPVDTAVIATENRSVNNLYFALKGKVKELYRVGDCVTPRGINDAIFEGYHLGVSL